MVLYIRKVLADVMPGSGAKDAQILYGGSAEPINIRDLAAGGQVQGFLVGHASADIASFSNIPACPNQWASTDVYDHPFELTITLKDTDGHQISETIHVVPTCSEPGLEAECRCICQKDYVLGQACDPNAGSGGGGGASKGAGGAGGSS